MGDLSMPVNPSDHISGTSNAPITLVEYADFECPNCREAHFIIKDIQQLYGNKIRLVYRHFPIMNIHTHAEHAAEISEAAAADGKFWKMHDMLFENQKDLYDDNLSQYASRLELDPERIVDALEKEMFWPKIERDILSAEESSVNETPAFFMNSKKYEGPYDFNNLIKEMEKIINKS